MRRHSLWTTGGSAEPSPADYCFSATASACWSSRAALPAPRMATRDSPGLWVPRAA